MLVQFEINLLTSINETQNFLNLIASFITSIIAQNLSKSAKGKVVTLQLHRFYFQQTLKACKLISKRFDMKEMISTFIDTSLLLQDLGVQPNDLYSFIKSVASETELQSLISLVLLCKAKDTVQVKDNLNLDSTEIKLVLRLLIDSP